MLHWWVFLLFVAGSPLADLNTLGAEAIPEALVDLNLLSGLTDSTSLIHLNLVSALANLTSRPLEKITTNNKDFLQIATEYGYNTEKHEVTTDDGYVLTMFRIMPASICTKKTPLLLMHGLFISAECFIDSGLFSPASVLAQECYDVWVGNTRGTFHSRKHLTLDPERDLKFWKFSVKEIGHYDIPAMVDYVLDATNTEKLIYFGFSQGGSVFFVMNSEKPKYADKIQLFVGLAPSSRIYNTKSLPLRTLFKVVQTLQTPLEAIGIWEVLGRGLPLQVILDTLCQQKLLAATVCDQVLSFIDSPHPGSITFETIQGFYEHFPAGTSVQTLAGYGQSLDSTKFVKMDYGSEKNLQVYGVPEPPEYDIGKTKMPSVIFHGMGDHIVDTRDIDWAVSQLPNVLEYITLDDPQWNHVDMVYSQYWKDNIFDRIKTLL